MIGLWLPATGGWLAASLYFTKRSRMQIKPGLHPRSVDSDAQKALAEFSPSIAVGPFTSTIPANDRAGRHDADLLASLHSARLRAARGLNQVRKW